MLVSLLVRRSGLFWELSLASLTSTRRRRFPAPDRIPTLLAHSPLPMIAMI